MNGILNYRNGSVVNCFNAKKADKGVVLQVIGAADVTADVTFNGIPATRTNYLATAEVPITQSRDSITMEIDHPVQGKTQQTIQIRYDRNEEKRYNFFIDDNIFCMTDIARERPASLFDHFYMKFYSPFDVFLFLIIQRRTSASFARTHNNRWTISTANYV